MAGLQATRGKTHPEIRDFRGLGEFRILTSYGSLLPSETQGDLNQAGVVCIALLVHRAGLVQVIFRQHKIRMIEQVEKLRSELDC